MRTGSAILQGSVGVVLIAGCASYSGYGLKPGVATADEVRRAMGEPATVCTAAGGGQNWVYPRGPAGLETFVAHLDPAGVLAGIEQVLDDRGFSRVRIGTTNQEEIRCLFGPPQLETYFAARRERVWDYRFRDSWGYEARYHVLFDDEGIVTKTMQIREERGGRK